MVDRLFERDEMRIAVLTAAEVIRTKSRVFGRDCEGAQKRSGRRSAAKIEWVRRRCFGNPIGQGITKNYGGSGSE